MEAKLIHETPSSTQLWGSFYQDNWQEDEDFYKMVIQQAKEHLKISKIKKQNSYIVFYCDNRIISKIDIKAL